MLVSPWAFTAFHILYKFIFTKRGGGMANMIQQTGICEFTLHVDHSTVTMNFVVQCTISMPPSCM